MKPMASKPACLPVLKNMGQVDCHDGDGDDNEGGKDDEDEEELPPSWRGAVCVPRGGGVHQQAACS